MMTTTTTNDTADECDNMQPISNNTSNASNEYHHALLQSPPSVTSSVIDKLLTTKTTRTTGKKNTKLSPNSSSEAKLSSTKSIKSKQSQSLMSNSPSSRMTNRKGSNRSSIDIGAGFTTKTSPSKRRKLINPAQSIISNRNPHYNNSSNVNGRGSNNVMSHGNNGKMKRKRNGIESGAIYFPITSFWKDITNDPNRSHHSNGSSCSSQTTTQQSCKLLFQYETIKAMDSKPPSLDSFIADQIITLPSSLSSSSSNNHLEYHSWPLFQPLIQQQQKQPEKPSMDPLEYKQICHDIMKQSNDPIYIRDCELGDSDSNNDIPLQQHQQRHQLSLSTFNFMLHSIHAGILLYTNTCRNSSNSNSSSSNSSKSKEKQQPQQHNHNLKYWIYIPVSMTRAKLIPLSSYTKNDSILFHPSSLSSSMSSLSSSPLPKSSSCSFPTNQRNDKEKREGHDFESSPKPMVELKSTKSTSLPTKLYNQKEHETDIAMNDHHQQSLHNDQSKEIKRDMNTDLVDFNRNDISTKWSSLVVKRYCHVLTTKEEDEQSSSSSLISSYVQNSFQPTLMKILDLVFTSSSSSPTSSSSSNIELTQHDSKSNIITETNVLDVLLRTQSIPLTTLLQKGQISDNDLLIKSNNDGNNNTDANDDGDCNNSAAMLMTKDELKTVIRKRNDSVNLYQDASDEANNKVSDDSFHHTTIYLRLLELQVLLRIELYNLLFPSDNNVTIKTNTSQRKQREDELKILRSSLGELLIKRKTKRPKKEKKKGRAAKEFSSTKFTSEVCSILEMISFILPNNDSFQDFVKNSIVKPYKSFGIVNELVDHFEMDLEDDMDESLDEASHLEDNNNSDDDKTEESNNFPSLPLSRWDSIKSNGRNEDKITQESKKDEYCEEGKNISAPNNYVFKQKMIVHNNTQNPLLANGRATYVGRQLSNNFYNNMKEVSSDTIMKAKNLAKKRKQIKVEQSVTEIHSERNDSNKNGIIFGSSANKQSNRKKGGAMTIKCNAKKEKHSKGRSPHGAAVLAARASLALRKKTTRN